MPPVVFHEVGDQPKSPFFKKFPPEIRKMIYTELFGSRLVHVLFHSSEHLKPESAYIKKGAPPRRKIPGWAHCVCQEDIKALPHQHSEKHHEWCYLSASIIFTCKYAFEEGIPILYGSNTLSYNQVTDFWNFTDMAGRYVDLITKLSLGFYLGRIDRAPVLTRAYADFAYLLIWLAKHKASCLDCQVAMALETVLFLKLLRGEKLADYPQIRFYLPKSSREFVEKILRDDAGNWKVEVLWQCDDLDELETE